MPSYLTDDDGIDYLDPDAPPKPFVAPMGPQPPAPAPTAEAPIPHPPGAGDQPTVREIMAQAQPQLPATMPLQDQITAAQQKQAQVAAQKPVPQSPKWWQRLAAGAVGAAAGYTNASGRVHVDPTAAVQGIYGVPGQQRAMAEWQKQADIAQSGVNTAQGNLTNWQRMQQLRTADERAQADEMEKRAKAQKESSDNDERAKAAKDAQNERLEASMLKPWGNDVQLQKEGDPVPTGMEITQSLTQPGMVWVHPPKMVSVPAELTDYISGAKPGDLRPYSQVKDAQKAHNDNLIKNENKPPALDKENENQWIATLADPNADAPTKAIAQAKLTRLRQERVSTQASQNPAPTTPMVQFKPGDREYKVAQDLAYGKITMQQFRSMTAYSRDVNKKMDIYNLASDLNPNFNPASFEMGFTMAKNPRVQQQLAALDNVKVAVPDLMKASDAATRSGATILNKAIIPGGVALGSKKYSNFRTARIAFADELSGALGFGSATDMSREMGFNMTDENLSPENFRSAVQDIVIPFVERKRGTMLKQMGIYGEPGMNPAAGQGTIPQTPTVAGGGGSSLPTGHKVGDLVSIRGGKQIKITAVHSDGSFDGNEVKQ